MTDVVIVSAARTAIGSFGGALSSIAAHELGATVIRAALDRAAIEAADVSDVVLGHVLTAGQGQNTARQASMRAGIPMEKAALTINQVCGSGLRAVALGSRQIKAGDATIVVAGGQESMSLSRACPRICATGPKWATGIHRHHDQGRPVGRLQRLSHGHDRRERRRAVSDHPRRSGCVCRRSQNKAEAAQEAGKFKDEIVARHHQVPQGRHHRRHDEYIRKPSTAESLAKLRPAFTKAGTVTAGNASGLNDGAAVPILMSADEAKRARAEAARPHRLLGDGRRRSRDHGHRSDPRQPARA